MLRARCTAGGPFAADPRQLDQIHSVVRQARVRYLGEVPSGRSGDIQLPSLTMWPLFDRMTLECLLALS